MIEGSVDIERVPSVQIEIEGRMWRAVIDTGLNGDLELPAILKRSLQARFIGRVRSLLAGGQIIDEDSYLVTLQFDGEQVTAAATFVPQEEILIGTRLLRRHGLAVDFVNQTVRIEHAERGDTFRSSLAP